MPARLAWPALAAVFLVSNPAWGQLDAVIGGARSVADQAHQKIMENEIIQLVITAKKNYDASMQIYKQVKQLNEGRGLVQNVASDLGVRGKQIAGDEKDSVQAAFTYRGDSTLDRAIEEAQWQTGHGIARSGGAIVDQYGNAINQQSAAYIAMLKKQGEEWAARENRSKASRQEGVKIASGAPDLNSKAQGLQLQTHSDSLDALNQLVLIETMRNAKEAGKEISTEKEIAESLKFLTDADGAAKALQESFYLIRLSRAPGLYAAKRQSVSFTVWMVIGLILGGALIYEFSQGRGIIPETIGLPLVLVLLGLAFYDKIFVSFAVIMDSLEQTIGSNQSIVVSAMQNSVQASVLGAILQGTMKYLAVGLGYMTWLVVIIFLWVRFVFFSLMYTVGPIFIVLGLFKPLRGMTHGWMQGCLQLGLWGLFMRIMVFVVVTSGATHLGDSSTSLMKPMFANLVLAAVFFIFSIICPYFTHHLVSGHIADKALATVSAGKSGATGAYGRAARAYQKMADRKENQHQ